MKKWNNKCNNKRYKALSVLLLAALLLSLAACGGGNTPGETAIVDMETETGENASDGEGAAELSGIAERAISPIAGSPYLSVKLVNKDRMPAWTEEWEEDAYTVTFETRYDKNSGDLLMSSVVTFSDKSEDADKSLLNLRDHTAWYKDNTLYKRVVPEQADAFMEDMPGFTDSSFTVWDDAVAQECSAGELHPSYMPDFTIYGAGDVLSETVEELPGGNTLVTQKIRPESAMAYAGRLTVTAASMEEDGDEMDGDVREEIELTLTYTVDKGGNLVEYHSSFSYSMFMWDELTWQHMMELTATDFSLEPVEIEFPPQSELDEFVRR